MSDRRCICGRPIQDDGRQQRAYCSAICRNKAFRMRQRQMGRRRTKFGYADGLSAWEARDTYGYPA
jgi:hypothetical protein